MIFFFLFSTRFIIQHDLDVRSPNVTEVFHYIKYSYWGIYLSQLKISVATEVYLTNEH